ncbi:hypothetical protein LRAMOSA10869 [Lichtheimia ramosa]|uniref:Heterokaryon incompatibility domain-containing protein n=1 Tax=Lichtheimia ramosa TaxID=688394 RepID=A0A077WQV2_9FUNG|nr:hypothetical protein LRAMOSA10869 [Lichtheimia ramosa]
MIGDTDDYNDPDQINICLEDDEDNKHKQFFGKRLGALLADEHFLLLYVPDNGAKMKIIRPASDSYHRQRMIKRINEAKTSPPSFYYALSHLWGVTEENRYIWNEISQYVDDEKGQPVEPVSMRPEKRDTLLTMLKDHPDSYWWIDVLCARTDTPLDIMGDIYTCCLECVAMIDCEPDLIPQINTAISTYEQASPVDDEKLPDLVGLYLAMIQSQWWNRVWTWQEVVLPFGEVRFMSETGTHLQGDTITFKYLFDSFFGSPTYTKENEEDRTMILHWLFNIHTTRRYFENRITREEIFPPGSVLDTLGESTRQCMDPVDYVYGVLGIFEIKMPRMKDPNAVWQLFLSKMQDHMNEPWCQEILVIQKISDRAKQVDLLNVKDMRDVYKDFIKRI